MIESIGRRLLFTAALLALVSSGCLVSTSTKERGRVVASDEVEKIQPGVTTRADVKELLGEPHETTKTTEDETYTYHYSRQSQTTILFLLHSEASRESALTITFGPDGVVRQVARK